MAEIAETFSLRIPPGKEYYSIRSWEMSAASRLLCPSQVTIGGVSLEECVVGGVNGDAAVRLEHRKVSGREES